MGILTYSCILVHGNVLSATSVFHAATEEQLLSSGQQFWLVLLHRLTSFELRLEEKGGPYKLLSF